MGGLDSKRDELKNDGIVKGSLHIFFPISPACRGFSFLDKPLCMLLGDALLEMDEMYHGLHVELDNILKFSRPEGVS